MRSWVTSGLVVVGLISCLGPRVASAEPYTPASVEEVVERLPANSGESGFGELRSMRDALANNPENVALAGKTAQRLIEEARRRSDPRLYGYAEAALAHWWKQENAPVSILVLRATILQHNHHFSEALSDLERALSVQPGNPQALVTKAVLLQVRGEYAQAKDTCAKLATLTTPVAAASCSSSAASLNGEAEKSYQLLSRTLSSMPNSAAFEQVWALTVLGEIAERLGRFADAEAHFRQALALDAEDSYLRAALADLLIDANRAGEALPLLTGRENNDVLLLKKSLAEQKAGLPSVSDSIAELAKRFAANRQRGDRVHLREEAAFALHLQKDSKKALALARENWEIQREPADLRILLETARAEGNKETVQTARNWFTSAKMEDVRIAQLLEATR